jgi:hypothetical protein
MHVLAWLQKCKGKQIIKLVKEISLSISSDLRVFLLRSWFDCLHMPAHEAAHTDANSVLHFHKYVNELLCIKPSRKTE